MVGSSGCQKSFDVIYGRSPLIKQDQHYLVYTKTILNCNIIKYVIHPWERQWKKEKYIYKFLLLFRLLKHNELDSRFNLIVLLVNFT